jgi:hypothetical protein
MATAPLQQPPSDRTENRKRKTENSKLVNSGHFTFSVFGFLFSIGSLVGCGTVRWVFIDSPFAGSPTPPATNDFAGQGVAEGRLGGSRRARFQTAASEVVLAGAARLQRLWVQRRNEWPT